MKTQIKAMKIELYAFPDRANQKLQGVPKTYKQKWPNMAGLSK